LTQPQPLKRLLGKSFSIAARGASIIGVCWIAVAVFVGLMDLQSAACSLALTAVSVPVFLLLKSRRRIAVRVGP
jgi:hypothetical protein